ncbi:phage tail protein [Salmonella enterica]|uniref:phage tail protein n=2 Tax=Salmonella enterica TaxID=28901 RepID=UPI0021B17D84|nr:phage tail protein [Salmonella enterica]MCT6990536.1 phage tail protein [Salmonella enterica subsp. enterica serovar Give]MCT7108499.1 phage tail protein [Salmonella enterica subsp. enterica serovar Give]
MWILLPGDLMADYYSVITNRGKELEAEALAGGSRIVLTKFVVGDSNGKQLKPDPAQTQLVNETFRGDISGLAASPEQSSQLMATLVLPPEVGGFTVREVGLLTDAGELYAVANCPDIDKPAGGISVNMQFRLAVSDTSDITLNVSTGDGLFLRIDQDLKEIKVRGETAQKVARESIGAVASTSIGFNNGSGWYKIATVVMPQSTSTAVIKLYGGAGYNVGYFEQAAISELVLRAGNGSPVGITATLWRRSPAAANEVAWINTSGDTYDIYINISQHACWLIAQYDYTGNANVTLYSTPEYSSVQPGNSTSGQTYTIYSSLMKPTAGDVGALPITGGQLNGPLGIGTDNALGGNSIVFGDNDTGFKQSGDGVLDVYSNYTHVLRFIGNLVESMVSLKVNGNAVATGEVQAGNGTSRMVGNGDIFGNVWNGWLSTHLNNLVADVQLGAGTSVATWNNAGSWPNTPGYVVTSVWKDATDANIDGIVYAPLQKRLGIQWYTVQGGTA